MLDGVCDELHQERVHVVRVRLSFANGIYFFVYQIKGLGHLCRALVILNFQAGGCGRFFEFSPIGNEFFEPVGLLLLKLG